MSFCETIYKRDRTTNNVKYGILFWDAKKRSLVVFGRWLLIGGIFYLQIIRARKSGRKRQMVVKHGGRKTQVLLYLEN